ncbi:MAG: hypothetical protein HC915_17325 [Anaerolineae bacterium]|nr:hypothetical protein [Anaerolineae bacterium]
MGRLEVDQVEVDLDPIVRGVLSTAVGLVGGKPIKLLKDLPDPLPMAQGDPVRIRQVLLNLYSNAAKFTDEGHITLHIREEADRVILAVQDSGVGIPQGNYELIFEEFRQAAAGRRQARQGSGLGLAISRQLVNLMGGDIWVESEVGQGSIFSFSLPRIPASDLSTNTRQPNLMSEGQ